MARTRAQEDPRAQAVARILFCLAAAAFCARMVSEDDIYMQMRAGEEIMRDRAVPMRDSWSYTVAGEPWINYQWLSMILFRVLYGFGAERALVLGRCALGFSLFYLLTAWLRRLAPKIQCGFALQSFLLPTIFLATAVRVQLRPETLGFVCYVSLLALWTLPFAERTRWAASLALGVVWANIHGGTAPFGVAAACALAWARLSARRWLVFSVCMGASMLAAPAHGRVLLALWTHLNYDTSVIFNSEYQGLSAEHFWIPRAGLTVVAWSILNIAGVIWAGTNFFRNSLDRSTVVRWAPAAVFGLLLTVLSVQRLRVIPYQVFFLAPIYAQAVASVAQRAQPYLAAPLLALMWSFYATRAAFGFGVDEEIIPTRLYERVARDRPRRELFGTFSVGNYQLWRLRDYPVFSDPRDVVFDSIKKEYSAAFRSPDGMREMLERRGVNAVLVELPKFALNRDGTPLNALRFFFPKNEWALIAFTDHWSLFYRRIPEHANLIPGKAFEWLEPGMPPRFAVEQAQVQRKEAELAEEVRRCLSEQRRPIYCAVVAASQKRAEGTKRGLGEAASELERLDRESERVSAVDRLRVLEELHAVYGELGDEVEKLRVEYRLRGFRREDFTERKMY